MDCEEGARMVARSNNWSIQTELLDRQAGTKEKVRSKKSKKIIDELMQINREI